MKAPQKFSPKDLDPPEGLLPEQVAAWYADRAVEQAEAAVRYAKIAERWTIIAIMFSLIALAVGIYAQATA